MKSIRNLLLACWVISLPVSGQPAPKPSIKQLPSTTQAKPALPSSMNRTAQPNESSPLLVQSRATNSFCKVVSGCASMCCHLACACCNACCEREPEETAMCIGSMIACAAIAACCYIAPRCIIPQASILPH